MRGDGSRSYGVQKNRCIGRLYVGIRHCVERFGDDAALEHKVSTCTIQGVIATDTGVSGMEVSQTTHVQVDVHSTRSILLTHWLLVCICGFDQLEDCFKEGTKAPIKRTYAGKQYVCLVRIFHPWLDIPKLGTGRTLSTLWPSFQ